LKDIGVSEEEIHEVQISLRNTMRDVRDYVNQAQLQETNA
jgi:hypothetical protein